ncbi:MAG TPA: MarR family winged helix-turn-helix transcriptional regulator [Candidatus Dormibacteraeota bacterium]
MSTSHDDLRHHPGHLIRRAQQVHYWLWNAEVSPEVTSPQFACLYALRAEKNIDQKTLGEHVSLDRSTVAEVVTRLTTRGLVQRFRDPRDARRNLLRLTPAGLRTTERLIPKAARMNRILVSVLSECEQAELLRMLNLVVDADESLRKSAPSPTLPRERVRERRALKAG